jgi:hypothetical protein
MKTTTLTILFSLFTGFNGLAKGPQSVQMEIKSEFNRNKRILGGFYQVNEDVTIVSNGKKVSLDRPVGDVVFKKGKLHIIRSIREGRISNYKVLALPINHKEGKMDLTLEGSKNKMLDIYKPSIKKALREQFGQRFASMEVEGIDFDKLTCKTSRVDMKCKLAITVNYF